MRSIIALALASVAFAQQNDTFNKQLDIDADAVEAMEFDDITEKIDYTVT